MPSPLCNVRREVFAANLKFIYKRVFLLKKKPNSHWPKQRIGVLWHCNFDRILERIFQLVLQNSFEVKLAASGPCIIAPGKYWNDCFQDKEACHWDHKVLSQWKSKWCCFQVNLKRSSWVSSTAYPSVKSAFQVWLLHCYHFHEDLRVEFADLKHIRRQWIQFSWCSNNTCR